MFRFRFGDLKRDYIKTKANDHERNEEGCNNAKRNQSNGSSIAKIDDDDDDDVEG